MKIQTFFFFCFDDEEIGNREAGLIELSLMYIDTRDITSANIYYMYYKFRLKN